MAFKRILDLCEKQGFLKRIINTSAVNELVNIGPVGALLLENIKTEWFYSMVINHDNNVFLSKDSFIDTYQYAKEISLEKLPFGIAEVTEEKIDKCCDFDKHFLQQEKLTLFNTTMFVEPLKSTQFFHQWQRQRRMWWRKFSASPDRYILTDIQIDDDRQNVEIKANYPWGSQLIESLTLSNGIHDQLDIKHLETKDGRKKVQAHYITSKISLPTMLLNTLCDAYDEMSFQEESRPLLRLHRKLAPYKISFSIADTQAAKTEELHELALYICKKLRIKRISSLLLPSAIKNTLESQFMHYDQLGIPYTIILKENTLKDGIGFLRSRDTTLKEQVHVIDLPNYIQQLFKNY